MSNTPDDNDDALQVRLEHVGVQRFLAERVRDGQPPYWARDRKFEDGNGGITLRSIEHLIVANLDVNVQKGDVFLSVSIDGAYEIGPESRGIEPEDVNDPERSLLSRIPDHLQNGLAAQASLDLYPYLRQAVHEASSKVMPVRPAIILAPVGIEFTKEAKTVRGRKLTEM